MNRTLIDEERRMVNSVRLAEEFLEEAVDTEKYLVNTSPSSMLVEMTPHEVSVLVAFTSQSIWL
jgi:hypothetical protein